MNIPTTQSAEHIKEETPSSQGERSANPTQPIGVAQEQSFILEEALPHNDEQAGKHCHRMKSTEPAGVMGLQRLEDAAHDGRHEHQALHGSKRCVPPRRILQDILASRNDGTDPHNHTEHKSQHKHRVDGEAEMLELISLTHI